MKRLLSLLLVTVLVFTLTACGGAKNGNDSKDPETTKTETTKTETTKTETTGTETTKEEDEGIKLAVCISVTGNIDDRSFCQGTWEGVKKYADEHGITRGYYQAADDSTDGFVNTIGLAIEGGAEVVVLPGYTWNAAVFKAQDLYPDVKLVLIDGQPTNEDYTEERCEDNVYSIYFAEQESGFLAGYAAVKEGYRNLGFIGGMAVPAVVRYGYGYIMGADFAAKELGLAADEVNIRYHYLGNFDASPENQTFATSWYSSGTECIFFCAGDVSNVGMAAAHQVGEKSTVIGVDVNQGWEDEVVLTSALKALGVATYDALDKYYNGEFPGGQIVTLGAKDNATGLPTDEETWRFKSFTMDEYNAIYEKLVTGEVSGIPVDTDYDDASKIPVELVGVEVV